MLIIMTLIGLCAVVWVRDNPPPPRMCASLTSSRRGIILFAVIFMCMRMLIGHRGSGVAMADSRLVLPQPFDFRKPDEWPRWLRRFEQYRVASGLSTEDEGKQVNTLLYCLDEEAGEVFAACDATDKAKKAASAYTFFALSVALSLHLVPAIEPCALENKILSHSEKLLERMDCFRVHLLRLVDGITRCEYLSCLLTQAIQQCVNLLPFVLCRKTRCHPVLLKASQVFGNVRSGSICRTYHLSWNWITITTSSHPHLRTITQVCSPMCSVMCIIVTLLFVFVSCPAQKVTCFRCHKRGHSISLYDPFSV